MTYKNPAHLTRISLKGIIFGIVLAINFVPNCTFTTRLLESCATLGNAAAAVQTDLAPGLYRVTNPQIVPVPKPTPAPLQRIVKTIRTITSATLPAVATIAVAASAASTAVVIASSPNSFLTILQTLLPFIALRRRSLPWGRVIEEDTSQPVAGALVTIFDSHGRPRTTAKTRPDGTFGALLPKGQYQMTVHFEGYEITNKPRNIALFPGENLYTGALFTVAADNEALTQLVVPLRPIVHGWIWTPYVFSLWHRLRVWQARLAVYILVAGSLITTIMLLQTPQTSLVILTVLYLVFLLFELFMSRIMKRAIGLVRDARTNEPIPLALARLIDDTTKRLVATEVTLPGGHFLLLPKPGIYTLQVIHPKYEPYSKSHIVIRRWSLGSISLAIPLKLRAISNNLPSAAPG